MNPQHGQDGVPALVRSLAEALGAEPDIGPAHFSRAFRQWYGHAPSKLLRPTVAPARVRPRIQQ